MTEFSASQVEAFLSCRRKYYYGSLVRLNWPAPFDRNFQKAEALTALGRDFHLAVQRVIQRILTIDEAIQTNQGRVKIWLEQFSRTIALPSDGAVYAELPLTMAIGEDLWNGKIDSLAVSGGRATIYDWKTTRRPGKRSDYAEAAQTRLYRALAVANRDALGIAPNRLPDIEMIYWFANFPDDPIRFTYSESAYAEDLAALTALAAEMRSTNEADYPRTRDAKTCAWCRYRTYCRPSSVALEFDEDDFEPAADDLMTIADFE